MLTRAQSDSAPTILSGLSPSGTARLTPSLCAGFEIWDQVKVPFSYTNRPVQQQRPALIVAVPVALGAPALLWVLMVTSAANRGWPDDVVVSDLTAAELLAASVVRSAKVATIVARSSRTRIIEEARPSFP